MKLLLPFFLFLHMSFLCSSKNINECNKLWGMNNEINGVTVSNIGIYMCIDDPLNIYSSINPPSNNILLTDKQLNIQNFNETIQRKINNTFNFSNITTTEPPTTTTTESPTTTTTTEPPTTTTTTEPPTTTTTEPPTIVITTPLPPTPTNYYETNPSNITEDPSPIKTDNDDVPLIVTLTTLSVVLCLLFCIRCNPLIYEFCKRKCKKLTEKKTLQRKVTPPTNFKIQENPKTRKISPIKIPPKHHAIDMPPQVITPKRKVSLGFNTMGAQNDWYRETFKTELSEFKDVESSPGPPPAPKLPTPKASIPTLRANLEDLGKNEQKNRQLNRKMDNIIQDIEHTKQSLYTNNNSNMQIREIGNVQQQIHSIEKRKKAKVDFRNVRLNSWTTPRQKGNPPGNY